MSCPTLPVTYTYVYYKSRSTLIPKQESIWDKQKGNFKNPEPEPLKPSSLQALPLTYYTIPVNLRGQMYRIIIMLLNACALLLSILLSLLSYHLYSGIIDGRSVSDMFSANASVIILWLLWCGLAKTISQLR